MDLTGVFGFLNTLVTRTIPDPTLKEQLRRELEQAQLAAETDLAKAQAAINQTEAANPNLFVSGWRPFIGWVCGLGLAYAFLIKPIVSPLVQTWTGTPLEALDVGTLLTLLFGMLGLGGMRTVEKLNGVARR